MDFLLHFNLEKTVEAAGYLGVFAMIFAESGLFIGVFFPGDSLLFTAGFLSSTGVFNVYFLALICFVAAVFGDNVGYAIGKRYGPKIFNKEDSIWFHKKHLERAEKFYEKYGAKTIVLARFTPIIRTFAPVVAGVGSMNYKTFFTYNIFGGFVWSVGVTFAGYFLGRSIPNVDKYLLPIVVIIIVVSLLPSIFHLIKEKMAV